MSIIKLPFPNTIGLSLHVLSAEPDSVAATVTSCSLGVRTYSWYATLSHRPNVLISESCMPLLAAVVAAPIRKLWPAYFVWSMPIC